VLSPASAAVQCTPAVISMENARKEFEDVVFPIVESVLKKTGVHPKQARTH
jgi:3-ketoacyl-CoA synthase